MIVKSNGSFPNNKKKVVSVPFFFFLKCTHRVRFPWYQGGKAFLLCIETNQRLVLGTFAGWGFKCLPLRNDTNEN